MAKEPVGFNDFGFPVGVGRAGAVVWNGDVLASMYQGIKVLFVVSVLIICSLFTSASVLHE